MGLFSKKTVENFEATKKFGGDWLQYDENRKLIKIKNSKKLIPVESVQDYQLTFGEKTYNKVNLSRAAIGGAVLGLAGVLLAGTHKEEYISNITIRIKAEDKFYFIPLTLGKIKASAAKGILNSAEDIIDFLDTITE